MNINSFLEVMGSNCGKNLSACEISWVHLTSSDPTMEEASCTSCTLNFNRIICLWIAKQSITQSSGEIQSLNWCFPNCLYLPAFIYLRVLIFHSSLLKRDVFVLCGQTMCISCFPFMWWNNVHKLFSSYSICYAILKYWKLLYSKISRLMSASLHRLRS